MSLSVHSPSITTTLNDAYISAIDMTDAEIEEDKIALSKNKELIAQNWANKHDKLFGLDDSVSDGKYMDQAVPNLMMTP